MLPHKYYGTDNHACMSGDQLILQLVRPSQTKYIRLYEAAGGTEILRIDASVSTDVSYPTNSSVHQLSFNTNYPFVSRQIYYILLDQGKSS